MLEIVRGKVFCLIDLFFEQLKELFRIASLRKELRERVERCVGTLVLLDEARAEVVPLLEILLGEPRFISWAVFNRQMRSANLAHVVKRAARIGFVDTDGRLRQTNPCCGVCWFARERRQLELVLCLRCRRRSSLAREEQLRIGLFQLKVPCLCEQQQNTSMSLRGGACVEAMKIEVAERTRRMRAYERRRMAYGKDRHE